MQARADAEALGIPLPSVKRWRVETGDDLLALAALPNDLPEVLLDSNGCGLLYKGRVNMITGHSSSGKSWLATEATRQELIREHRVLWVDSEGGKEGKRLAKRLQALGLPRHQWSRLRRVNPSGWLDHDTWDELLAEEWSLVVVDSFTAVQSALEKQADSNSGDSVERFIAGRLERLADTGAAVLVIDHKPKAAGAGSRGAIGSERKLSALQGAVYSIEVILQPAPGALGEVRLILDKDNEGTVMARLASDRERYSQTIEAARIIINSAPMEHKGAETVISIQPPLALADRRLELFDEYAQSLLLALEQTEDNKLRGKASIRELLRVKGHAIANDDLPRLLEYGNERKLWKAERDGAAKTSAWVLQGL